MEKGEIVEEIRSKHELNDPKSNALKQLLDSIL
jgi:ABC-type dipeptide/oligopeptide/nickel transport system ATPase component